MQTHKPYPSPAELVGIYAHREAVVASLLAAPSIEAKDVAELDRLGRCKLANEGWRKASPEARWALLNDPHPHVRSCAFLASLADRKEAHNA